MKNNKRVVITAIGVASNNGIGKEEYYKNCVSGTVGIKKCSLFPTEKFTTDFFGEITDINLPDSTVCPNSETRMKSIMCVALDEMMTDGKLDRETIEKYSDGVYLFFGTLLATTDGIMEYADRKKRNGITDGYLEHVNDYLPYIRNFCGVKGGSFVSSAACAAGTTAAGMAFDFIKNGLCNICIVGGADTLTKVSAAGFHALKSLSSGICNPYDENKDGINIGEGAAFFIFEELESAKARNAHIYGEIMGYGSTNDAYHITSPDPEGGGVIEAMSEAVCEGGLTVNQIQHINGHGTGTVINDQMETGAINKLFDGKNSTPMLTVTSTKALIGHCMGASGSLELAALLLAIENQVYMPLPNLKNPICGLDKNGMADNTAKTAEIIYALSNSFAFAGNIASILIGRYKE